MLAETLEFSLRLLRNLRTGIVVRGEHLVLFPTKSCFVAIELPAVDIASERKVGR